MHGTGSMHDDMVSVGAPIPRIQKALPLGGRKVAVVWTDGRTKTIDLAPALAGYKVYAALRTDDALFRTLAVGEYGSAIQWADGSDFSAEWIEALPPAGMPNSEFRGLMEHLDLSPGDMAATLEVPRRLIDDYISTKPIPNHIALALLYLAESKTPAR